MDLTKVVWFVNRGASFRTAQRVTVLLAGPIQDRRIEFKLGEEALDAMKWKRGDFLQFGQAGEALYVRKVVRDGYLLRTISAPDGKASRRNSFYSRTGSPPEMLDFFKDDKLDERPLDLQWHVDGEVLVLTHKETDR